jgi:molybdenum cofactor cytidylyltransferase
VILAAGASRRFGRQKLLEPLDGRPLIAHALDAAAAWPVVVVASEAVAAEVASASRPDVRVVRNDEPDRGMTHSLRLADAAIPRDEPIAVLLADMPDCDAPAIARAIDAYDVAVDVVIPRAGERLGHPVVFGPIARERIATLPEGDVLHRLRDDPTLRRRFVDVPDARAFVDIDTEADLRARG